ncbi:MAG: SsrA-binding protein SmpB [Endomicrobiia bacterium]
MQKNTKLVYVNKKIFHNYDVIDTYQAGIVLKGSEVKSIREGNIDIRDAYCVIKRNEVWLINSKIAPYSKSSHVKLPIDRERKLLLHKDEIKKIIGKISQKGLSLLPTKIYFNERNYVKVEIALCKYKKIYDRREEIKRKELKRELEAYKKHNYQQWK